MLALVSYKVVLPLIFLIFIDDRYNVMSDSTVLAFADDFNMGKIINPPNDSLFLQHDLDMMHLWCQNNIMNLNIAKCETITFSRK